MLAIIGLVVVFGAVVGGYLMEQGHLAVLVQPAELLIIGGAGFGSLLISCPIPMLKSIFKQVVAAIFRPGTRKAHYTELLLLLFELFKLAKANPLSIEAHVEKPDESDIFKKYPGVLANLHAVHFLCDTLKVQVSSPMSPYDLEELMDIDLNSAHEEDFRGPATISRIGDAMPGLGIVAAVLGVVITMGKLAGGKEMIGHSVAAALIGTFLGVLSSYGFMQPLAAKMEGNLMEESKYLQVIKVCLLAFAKQCPPKVCVEFGRRMVAMQARPSFDEIDEATSTVGRKAA
jgi:chemotaxis protein MotA